MVTFDRDNEASKKACAAASKHYLSMFPSVPSLSSTALLSMQRDASKTTFLVDVRTQEERLISVIPGSISLEEFEKLAGIGGDKTEGGDINIVCSCTMGYRSGIRALDLMSQFKASPNVNIFNHHGIVPYTHEVPTSDKMLVTLDGEPTNVVHTHGEAWSYLDHNRFEAVWFSKLGNLLKGLQMAPAAMWTWLVSNISAWYSKAK